MPRVIEAVARPRADPRAGRRSRRLTLAAGLAALVAALALLALVADGSLPPTSEVLAAMLVAAGALCLAALTVDRSPAAAWPAALLAAIAATEVPIRLAGPRAPTDPPVDPVWLPLALAVVVCATMTTSVAALYATRPERAPGVAVRGIAWGAVILVGMTSLLRGALLLAGADEPDPFTASGIARVGVRAWLPIVLGLGAVGAMADIRPAVDRARARIAADREMAAGPLARLSIVVDELLGRGEGRRAAAEAERRRLASELHAEALPSLRRAMARLEAGRPPEETAAELRALATELEGAVTERRDPVLESLGIVAGLERLAERTEDRGGPTVELHVADASVGRAPLEVERSALRIATLAVDNAVRHAASRRILVTVEAGPDRLMLVVADDGRGVSPDVEVRAAMDGRHGLADMRAIAADRGAALVVEPSAGDGTVVRFSWPA